MSEDILATLDNLTEEELSRFKWFLQQPEILPGLPSLTTKHLENAKRLQVLDVMLKTYTLQQSLEITCQILKKINRNDLQQRLLQSKKEELKKKDSEFQEMIKYRQGKIEEIRVSIKISKDDEDKQKAEGVEVFTALKESVVRGLMELINEIEDKQKTAEKQAEDLIKELEQEICALLKRSSEVKQLSQSKDHLHFLQRFSSVKATPPTKSWTKIRVHPPSYDGPVERAVGLLEEKIKEKRKEAELRRHNYRDSSG
uniref:Pyrin domain-containing protein n=1 Tax=Cyprinodon variegatus TaxID=28743 RepID=A0A3Q2CI79_CYPVA